jgi:hypothetical protein
MLSKSTRQHNGGPDPEPPSLRFFTQGLYRLPASAVNKIRIPAIKQQNHGPEACQRRKNKIFHLKGRLGQISALRFVLKGQRAE